MAKRPREETDSTNVLESVRAFMWKLVGGDMEKMKAAVRQLYESVHPSESRELSLAKMMVEGIGAELSRQTIESGTDKVRFVRQIIVNAAVSNVDDPRPSDTRVIASLLHCNIKTIKSAQDRPRPPADILASTLAMDSVRARRQDGVAGSAHVAVREFIYSFCRYGEAGKKFWLQMTMREVSARHAKKAHTHRRDE